MIEKLEFILNTVKTLKIPIKNPENQLQLISLSMDIDNYFLKNETGKLVSFDRKQFIEMLEDSIYLNRSDYAYFNGVKISVLLDELISTVNRISNYKFYVIPARSPEYKSKKQQYEQVLSGFKNYNASNSPKTSGKASSYHGYIIRSIIHFEKMYGYDIDMVNPYVSFQMLNGIKASVNFESYNKVKKWKYHFGSSLASYEKYCYSKLNQSERLNELELNIKSEELELDVVNEEFSDNDSAVKEPKGKTERTFFSIDRSALEVNKAKRRNNWKCLHDENHKTFISRTGNDYVEGHHFLPLYSQGSNPVNLDVSENIATLCPTCHALIHYGEIDSKIEMITDLYNKMSKGLLSSGIKTSLEDIIELYKGGW